MDKLLPPGDIPENKLPIYYVNLTIREVQYKKLKSGLKKKGEEEHKIKTPLKGSTAENLNLSAEKWFKRKFKAKESTVVEILSIEILHFMSFGVYD